MEDRGTAELRKLFINVENSVNLAACSQGALLFKVRDSFQKYLDDQVEFGNPWDIWSQKAKEFQKIISRLINAREDEIAVQSSVSSSYSSLLSSFDFKPGDNILTNDLEYPTTNFISLAQERRGAKVITVRNINGEISPENIEENLNTHTRLVTSNHVSSLNGFKMDVENIAKKAHENNSFIYIDAYQSLGAMNVDIRKLDVDFLASGTLKWLLGASGVAFLYVKGEIAEGLEPTDIGWFSQSNPFKFGANELNYAAGANRFQSGTWSIPSLYASIEGVRTIMEVGVRRIERKIRNLTDYTIHQLSNHGFSIMTPMDHHKRGGIIAINMISPERVEKILREKYKIFTSARGNALRIAPHFYNTMGDIDTFVQVLKDNFRDARHA
ncbi:MAG: aminotransferase class V-fold PLP-dependent enzyme [Cuniculiplasma sp.]